MVSDGSNSDDGDEPEGRPVWLTADKQDFVSTDIEAPIVNCSISEWHQASGRYAEAVRCAVDRGDAGAARAYSMLQAIVSFRFKPDEPGEPFLPIYSDGHNRSPVPQDFRGKPCSVLADVYPNISNSYLRARVADVCWWLDKALSGAGVAAVEAYINIVESTYRGSTGLDSNGMAASIFHARDYMYRALSIGRATGWDKSWTQRAKDLAVDIQNALRPLCPDGRLMAWYELNLNFEISEFSLLAAEIEELVANHEQMQPNLRNSFWKLAAQAYHYAKDQDAENRCRKEAAECLVGLAETNASAMFSSHWLQVAIAEYQGIPGTKDRRKELRHRLIDVQAGVIDEMASINHSDDISDIIKPVEECFRGLSLMESLGQFAFILRSPAREPLEVAAVDSIRRFPLSSLFGITRVDHEGKVIHRGAGGGTLANPDAETIENQIAQHEQIRRNLSAKQIEAARAAVLQSHSISEGDFGFLCTNSPFVPAGHTLAFARGFYRFFYNDMVGALSILVPQLENSLRHVLKSWGYDVTVLKSGMTQEDRSLSSLFDQMREELVSIFGAALVDDLDRVFLNGSGPRLRHRLAHGLLFDGSCFGPDAVYACWLVFHLCCLPLLPHWKELEDEYAKFYRP